MYVSYRAHISRTDFRRDPTKSINLEISGPCRQVALGVFRLKRHADEDAATNTFKTVTGKGLLTKKHVFPAIGPGRHAAQREHIEPRTPGFREM